MGSTALAPIPCPVCGAEFSPRPRQRVCSESCRWREKDARRREDPRRVAALRSYWQAHRPTEAPTSPWHYGAPPYPITLPGGSCSIAISPEPRDAVAHRHARHLHGVLCHMLGRDHDNAPAFALRPSASGCGWSVRWADDDGAAIAGRSTRVPLLGSSRILTLGQIEIDRTPTVFQPRGRRRVRLDAITPVVIRSSTFAGAKIERTAPEASHIASALRGLADRLHAPLAADAIQIELIERHTQPEAVPLGGKFPRLKGFIGSLVLEANAPARWLLFVAERMGLGGRTALGFGVVHVEEMPR